MKKICFIGCGNIVKQHAQNLKNNAELYFYSRTQEKADNYNRDFEGKGVFKRFDDVMKSEDIDAVFITTPPDVHKEQIINSLESRKSVIVEKPMVTNQDEIDDLQQVISKSSAGFFMVAENYYYKPVIRIIKDLIQKNKLGKIEHLFVRKTFQQNSTDWRTQYGALLEGGIHFIALISAIVDKQAIEVNAEFPGYTKGTPERTSRVNINFEDNVSAELVYSWNTDSITKGLFQHSKVECENGTVVFESNGIYVHCKGKVIFNRFRDITGFKTMTEDIIDCLDNGKKPLSNFDHAVNDLEIVFKAYSYL